MLFRSKDFISLIKSEELVLAGVTRQIFSKAESYNVLVKEANPDKVTAKSVSFDFIKIDKEVFKKLESVVPIISRVEKDNIFDQHPIFFASTLEDHGVLDDEANFALLLEKANIDIKIDPTISLVTHYPLPMVSRFGQHIRTDFVERGFKDFE